MRFVSAVFVMVVAGLRAWFAPKAVLVMENLALRQQLAVLKRGRARPRLRPTDRVFLLLLAKCWSGWRSALVIVKPETVIHWHRTGYLLFWRWKSKKKTGRPPVAMEVRTLIRRLSHENPRWGTPRIQSELRLLGHDASAATVDKYRVRPPRPPSQKWRSFLANHADGIVAMDFLTVPTATFRNLYVMLFLSHDRRRILHFNVTGHPTAAWAAQQLVEAFPYDTAPKFILRDNDAIYGLEFRRRAKGMGITEIRTAPHCPKQNAYAERVIGSVRRECLDHLIVLNERHLCRIMHEYVTYYNADRPHLSLERNAPQPRNVQPPEDGAVTTFPVLGGLHHRYERYKAA